jgi:hypothetical protein
MPATREIHRLVLPPKDMRYAAVDMSIQEAQYMVEEALLWKKIRQAAGTHARILKENKQRNYAIKFIHSNAVSIRDNIRLFLDIWTDQFPAACWVKSINGLGPTVAAGLTAFVAIEKAPTISSLWKYAGYTPNSRRISRAEADNIIEKLMQLHGDEPGEDHLRSLAKLIAKDESKVFSFCKPITWKKIDSLIRSPEFHPTLRSICIAAGKQFEWKQGSIYNELYKYYKKKDHALNEKGHFKKKAQEILDKFDYNESTIAYQAYIQGMLPKAHIANRAKIRAVKAFLAHYWQAAYYALHREEPPNCYAIDVLGGGSKLIAPNMSVLKEKK